MIPCNAVALEVSDTVVLRATLNDVQRAVQCSLDHVGKAPYRTESCSQGDRSNWFGGYSLSEFNDLLRNGDSTLVTDVLGDLDVQIADNAEHWQVRRAPMGFYPCIPAHLAGVPDSMYSLRSEESPQRKAITLFYNVGFSSGTASATVEEYGRQVMLAINQLHAERIDVSLYGYVYVGIGSSKKRHLTVIKVQSSEDVFTPERIAATLPSSFCRRGVFGLWEHMAHEQNNKACDRLIRTNYGRHDKKLDLAALKEALPNIDTDSIVLLPEVSEHVNPAHIWEPINLRLNRRTDQ